MQHDDPNPQDVLTSWVEMTRLKDDCPDDVFDLGFSLNTLAFFEPEQAWVIINMIIDTLDRQSLYEESPNDSKLLASNLGAGPLESLIAQHGVDFIDRVEKKSKSDDRMTWVLGCMWKNEISDHIWQRIRQAAGGISR
jgi:hypothetical protein